MENSTSGSNNNSSSFGEVTFYDNPTGWGPTVESIPERFVDVPFAQYRKFDSLSKVADNFGFATTKSRGDYTAQSFQAGTSFNTYGSDDTSAFKLSSDYKKKSLRTSSRSSMKDSSSSSNRPPWQQQNRSYGGQQYNKPRSGGRGAGRGSDNKGSSSRFQGNRNTFNKPKDYKNFDNKSGPNFRDNNNPFKKNNYRQDKATRDTSVEVKADWKVVEQIDFSDLRKIKGELVSDPELIKECGVLYFYDQNYDSIEVRSNTPLQRQANEKTYSNSTTTDDQVIRELSLEYAEKYPDQNIFFITDSILSHLMTCPRSQYSWDVIIRKVGKQYFFDKREDSNIDLPTVNETSGLPSNQNEDHSADRLSQEAGYINRIFAQQVLSKTKNPFRKGDIQSSGNGEDETAPVLYRYRKWELGDNNILVVRCEVNCAIEDNGKTKFGLIKALNEYDPGFTGVDWRRSLQSNRGTVLATEIKNNAHKLAKWTMSAMLGGCEWIKLGYVSRTRGVGLAGGGAGHAVLGVQSYRPLEFGPQSVGLSVPNLWGVWKLFMDMSKGIQDGTHILVKDPSKGVVRLYEVPDDAFEDGEGQDDDADV